MKIANKGKWFKRFCDNESIYRERTTMRLTFTSCTDGDYYRGKAHIRYRFEDENGTEYDFMKEDSYKDSPFTYLKKGESVTISGYFIPEEINVAGNLVAWFDMWNPRILRSEKEREHE